MPLSRHSRLAAALLLGLAGTSPVLAQEDNGLHQDGLPMLLNPDSDRSLEFDWPILQVGTGEYPDGPTGVTVFHFQEKVLTAVDIAGGGPGTVNAEYLQLGYDYPEVDTIVFSGGSWYGLETVTAVATAMKDDGIRDGNAFSAEPNIALSVGSIIFDFGSRRLNEIHPDRELAQATFRASEPGRFPLGAHGAGRFAKTGAFFGCNAFGGQGGAYREIGDLRIAAFTVVNAFGVVSDREGRLAACYEGENWPEDVRVSDLMSQFPESRSADWGGEEGPQAGRGNTTVSLIVVNQRLTPDELERLAAQVHLSMARAIQPFGTLFDGDVLYAVSTAELDEPAMMLPDLGAVASEVMWDAILSSVPEQPVAEAPDPSFSPDRNALSAREGTYVFSPFVSVEIEERGGRLYARATGERSAYGIDSDEATELLPVSEDRFTIPGRYPLTIAFDGEDTLVFNPGHWEQRGERSDG